MDAQKQTGESKKSSYASHQESLCRVVAPSDGKLPSSKSSLPPTLRRQQPNLLNKLGLIYKAISLAETQKLEYLEDDDDDDEESTDEASDEQEEQQLVSLLRNSLEDAGFQELTQRDVDLCEALNAGYLLRLSIQPDVDELDSSIAAEFYPERYHHHHQEEHSSERTAAPPPPPPDDDELFEGRILIYRRGYSSETTNGRLLLPKLDYLQASLVQESAKKMTQQLRGVERSILKVVDRLLRRTRMLGKAVLESVSDSLPALGGNFTRTKLGWRRLEYSELKDEIRNSKQKASFKLDRYGGSKVRFGGNPNPKKSLARFQVCQTMSEDTSKESKANGSVEKAEDIKRNLYERVNKGEVLTTYDSENPNKGFERPMASNLLERVSIGNVVDVFSATGRKRMLKDFFSKAALVEPTYEEVVVIWRPVREKTPMEENLRLPDAVYDAAEIFDVDDKLPEKPMEQRPRKLQVRAFTKVPMANLPGVFPKTRLLFRPADAFLFDLTAVFTFLAVLGSQRFDSTRLDLLALISVALWISKTFFRYRNKMSRYDLLVKTFLTSKIAYRDGGAIKYIADEGASQKAIRAAVLHSWLLMQQPPNLQSMTRNDIVHYANVGVNEMLQNDEYVDIDIEAGLKDLEKLELISYSSDGEHLIRVSNGESAVAILKSAWSNVFEGEYPQLQGGNTIGVGGVVHDNEMGSSETSYDGIVHDGGDNEVHAPNNLYGR